MSDRCRFVEITHVHQPDGWISPGYLVIDADGVLKSVSDAPPHSWRAEEAERLVGFAVPGMPNLHSHGFQRLMAGRTERGGDTEHDDFWSWREAMYDVAERVGPDELEAAQAWLFVEMLKAGMTVVGEFHYLHHAPGGKPYDDPAELALRVVAAAEQAGIALTHLPVLYAHGGIGKPLGVRQTRFGHADVQDFLRIVESIARLAPSRPLLRVGMAPHSLRAVSEAELRAAITGVDAIDPSAPIHIHIAEQQGEVADCERLLGERPVAWLLNRFDVDARWCLVHATHLDDDERRRAARSGAVAGLCPTTEANLGDGLFPIVEWLQDGGTFGVGSDSQISVSVGEELRLLEYGQRLTRQRRNVIADPASALGRHVGRRLYDAALAGGARALGQPVGSLVAGRRADFVVLDPEDPRLYGHGPETVLDAWVFSAGPQAVRDVCVGGDFVVRDGRHVREEQILADFKKAVRALGDQA